MRLALLALLVASPALAGEGAPEPEVRAQKVAPAAEEAEEEETVPPEDTARAYVLDARQSQLYALLYKKGVASAVAHDHVIEAGEVQGEATIDLDDPTRSSIEVVVSVSGLNPDREAKREELGLPTNVSERQRSEILDHILSEAQLFVEKYDRIRFRSTAFASTEDGVDVTGDFTLRGVTREITVPMTLEQNGDTVRARGTFRILQSDYGYEPYRALLGAIQNKDEVDIVVDARLRPR